MKTYMKFLSMIVILFTFSCEDYLQKYPLDKPSNKTFYSNKDEILMAVNACYNYLTNRSDERLPGFANELSRENITDIAATRSSVSIFTVFKTGNLSSNSPLPLAAWKFCYQGISKTNSLLEGMAKAEANTDPVLYKRVQSEARVIRAYMYINLVNDFGDVPLITEFIDVQEAMKIKRTPVNEIVQFIYKELDEAANNLPAKYTTTADKGRITKGAALALKARMALYNKDYVIARQAAKSVIDLSLYKLYPNYRDLFTYKAEYCDEIILDYQFKNPERTHIYHGFNAPRNSGGQSQCFPTEDLVASFECTDGLPVDESPLYDPTNPFANRDPRLFGAIILPRVWDGNTIKSKGTVFNGMEYMSSKETLYGEDGTTKLAISLSEKEKTVLDTKTNTMKANQEVTNVYSSFTGYCIYKYMEEANIATPTTCHNNFIICRYAEVLFIYAEASIELNQIDQTVLDAINLVRARAYGNTNLSGITNIAATNYPKITSFNQVELRKVIRRERKVELCFEGFRFDDLKRWGILEKALNNRRNYGRPENFSKMGTTDIPVIDDDGLVSFPYAESRYGLNNEVRKLRFWEAFGTIPSAYNLYPIPLNEIQLNPELTQNPGYN